MTENIQLQAPVLITGDSKLIGSVAVCLMLAQQPVTILTGQTSETLECIDNYAAGLSEIAESLNLSLLEVTDKPNVKTEYSSAIILSHENLQVKKSLITQAEDILSPNKVITINTESFPLSELQKRAKSPGRIIGVNWVEPAHTTYFMEVILNGKNDGKLANDFVNHAKKYWKKDPYIINTDHGIRARLMCALIREAFYLVENGYVDFEDVDRACRNDAGYYLPFAGNFRYMDLMGTYIYGIVMKDMNPDLSRQQHMPSFFKDMIEEGRLGMATHQGFYEYAEGETDKWNALAKNFSYQVRDIMERYHEVI